MIELEDIQHIASICRSACETGDVEDAIVALKQVMRDLSVDLEGLSVASDDIGLIRRLSTTYSECKLFVASVDLRTHYEDWPATDVGKLIDDFENAGVLYLAASARMTFHGDHARQTMERQAKRLEDATDEVRSLRQKVAGHNAKRMKGVHSRQHKARGRVEALKAFFDKHGCADMHWPDLVADPERVRGLVEVYKLEYGSDARRRVETGCETLRRLFKQDKKSLRDPGNPINLHLIS